MAKLNRIPGVKRRISRTQKRLWDIAAWKAFWPLLALVVIFVAVASLGGLGQLSDQAAAVTFLMFAVGIAISGIRGWRAYETPSREQAIEALDSQSELRPLSSIRDRPARPEKEGVALWRAHSQRLTDAARRMKVPWFKEVWSRIDPAFLRFALPALLVLGLAIGGTKTPSRLWSALNPDYGSLMGADTIRIEAWISPPGHTGEAPILFKPDQTDARVPAGSIITIRVQAPSAPKLKLKSDGKHSTVKFEPTPDGAFEQVATIEADTNVSVHWWGERRRFEILASPDDPPTVSYVELPKLGESDDTVFSWAVTDDYGVDKLEFAIRPEGSDREFDTVAVDLGAVRPEAVEGGAALDMTRHRYAGLRVEARLKATDGAGQIGYSEPHVFILPEKLLLQPLAKAIQDVRVTILREDAPYDERDPQQDGLAQGELFLSSTQRLDGAPDGIKRASFMLDSLTYGAPRYYDDILMYTGLRSAQRSLEVAESLEEAKALEPLLWGLALRAEYGSAADAYAALMAAKAALEEALRDGASEEEIKRLTEAFKGAAMNYLAARMAEAMAQGLDAPPETADGGMGGGGPSVGGSDFADMLDALEDLTETGATDQARQLLADITNMLENLEFQQGQGSGEGMPGLPGEAGEGEEDDTPQEERELSDTMRELSELLRQQRELNDETLAEQRGERGGRSEQGVGQSQETPGDSQGDPFGPDGNGEDLPDWMQNENGQGDGDGRTLAERQDRLGDLVEELTRRLEEGDALGGEDGEEGIGGLSEDALDAIERAQRRAGRALEDGNESRALRNQEQATRQLRDLAEGLAEELDRLQAERTQSGENGQSGNADPFGRSAIGGIDDSDSVDIPDQIERQRARDILDELRRRYEDAADEDEREYLERLLDRF